MFFVKIARSYLFTSASASLYSYLSLYLSSLLLPSIPTPCFPLSLLQLPSIPTPCFSLSCPCFHLSSLLLPFIPASASLYPRFCFHLFLALLPSILVPSQICFSTSPIHQ